MWRREREGAKSRVDQVRARFNDDDGGPQVRSWSVWIRL